MPSPLSHTLSHASNPNPCHMSHPITFLQVGVVLDRGKDKEDPKAWRLIRTDNAGEAITYHLCGPDGPPEHPLKLRLKYVPVQNNVQVACCM